MQSAVWYTAQLLNLSGEETAVFWYVHQFSVHLLYVCCTYAARMLYICCTLCVFLWLVVCTVSTVCTLYARLLLEGRQDLLSSDRLVEFDRVNRIPAFVHHFYEQWFVTPHLVPCERKYAYLVVCR